ncbi:zinc-dependent alcohol dehydrogenase family protein [Flavitalea flava]
MKAIYFEQTGDPRSVLRVREMDMPVPGPGEVRVKMLGSPINPADHFFIQGKYRFQPEFPQVAGLEGAGIVESAGRDVQIPIGSLVAFIYKNTWAEYTVVSEKELFVLPPGFPVEKACQFALNPPSAWGLLQRSGVKSGDWLMLSAGNSSLARTLTQVAAKKGIRLILTVRGGNYGEELKALGATEIISTPPSSFKEKVNSLTDGKGVNAVLDPVGGETATELLQCLAPQGKMILYGTLDPALSQFPNALFVYKDISLQGFGIRGYLNGLKLSERGEMMDSLTGIISDPGFVMDVAARYPLNEYRQAIDSDHMNNTGGKVLFLNN